MTRAIISEWSRLDSWTRAGRPVGVDRFWGWHRRTKCCPYIIEWFTSAFTYTFSTAKLYCIKSWIKTCNILYWEHLIYGLYVCTCVFLLQQESFDMILVNNPSFAMGVLHWPSLKKSRTSSYLLLAPLASVSYPLLALIACSLRPRSTVTGWEGAFSCLQSNIIKFSLT
jgi:hypothetical protein